MSCLYFDPPVFRATIEGFDGPCAPIFSVVLRLRRSGALQCFCQPLQLQCCAGPQQESHAACRISGGVCSHLQSKPHGKSVPVSAKDSSAVANVTCSTVTTPQWPSSRRKAEMLSDTKRKSIFSRMSQPTRVRIAASTRSLLSNPIKRISQNSLTKL